MWTFTNITALLLIIWSFWAIVFYFYPFLRMYDSPMSLQMKYPIIAICFATIIAMTLFLCISVSWWYILAPIIISLIVNIVIIRAFPLGIPFGFPLFWLITLILFIISFLI